MGESDSSYKIQRSLPPKSHSCVSAKERHAENGHLF